MAKINVSNMGSAPKSTTRTILVATAVTGLVGSAGHVAKGGETPMRNIAGAFAAGFGLAVLAEFVPDLAAGLAMLMMVSTVFSIPKELTHRLRDLLPVD